MNDSIAATPDSGTDMFGLDAVREVLRLIGQTDITEILIERGDNKLHVKRGFVPQSFAHSTSVALPEHQPLPFPTVSQPVFPQPAAGGEAPVALPTGHTITAPMVGTYYAASSPKDPPFVQEGDEIRAGDTVGIIEAMKMMNEIESDAAGRVVRILVKNGQPVEYGQPIMVIEPL